MGHPIRLELTLEGLLTKFVNNYTTGGTNSIEFPIVYFGTNCL